MAVNTPFFSKREPQVFNPRATTPNNGLNNTSSTLQTASSTPSAEAFAPAASDKVNSTGVTSTSTGVDEVHGGSKLTVGPNIKLKGVEITDCDTLVVEGTVEATMDSRVIHIAEQGAFHGAAEVDVAEIHGEFTGSLTVRQKLMIHSTGKVSGKVRYGKIVMEEGGQLSGEVMFGIQPWPKSQTAEKAKDTNPLATSTPAALAAVN